jgi:hypothetical protein
MYHRRPSIVLVVLASGLALAGCSSSNPKDSSARTTTAPATSAAAASVSPTAASATPIHYRVGQTYHWDGGEGVTGTATVLGYRQPALASDPPGTSLGVPAGSQWGRLDIKICLTTGDPISVSQDPWHLQFADGSQADNTGLNGGDFPKPEFPQDSTVLTGRCVRGGIMFPIPKGQRPTQVVYSPDSMPTPTYWDLPKK